MAGVELSDMDRLARAVQSLRNFIRDKKELNRLLQGQFESTDEECRQAIIEAVMDWSMSPPMIGAVTLGTHPNKFLLIRKAAINLITGAGIYHTREHLPSSDGGTSSDDHVFQASTYPTWLQTMVDEYEKKKSDLKTAMNIMAAMGNLPVPSEYANFQFSGDGNSW